MPVMYSFVLKSPLVSFLPPLTSSALDSSIVPRDDSLSTVHINGVTLQGNLSYGIESFYNMKFGKDTGGEKRFSSPQPFRLFSNHNSQCYNSWTCLPPAVSTDYRLVSL